MVDVVTDITIERPVEEVGEYAGDPSNAPKWYVNIESVAWKTEPPVQVGSLVEFVARFLGRQLRYTYEVVELAAAERLVMCTAQGPFPMETTYAWTRSGEGHTTMTFTDRLITQRNSSPQTIAAYRDTFKLLLRFAHAQTGKQPFELDIDDLDAPLIGAFLTHLERDRGNSARTRNARLGAIHSFYRFAALEHPEHAHTIARVMAIPTKRHERNTVCYLDLNEIKALLAVPDRNTWLGRRDRALVALMIQTGVRVSELVGLHVGDVHLGTGRHIRVLGKGRKKRATPLTAETAAVLRTWLTERGGAPEDPLFPTRQGRPLSRYTIGLLVSKQADTAAIVCPSLKAKRVTPHTLRHTAAMLWRAKGVDIATIALLLGHESTQTTHIYEHADTALKEKAIARTAPLGVKPGRYRPSDTLLAFLDGL